MKNFSLTLTCCLLILACLTLTSCKSSKTEYSPNRIEIPESTATPIPQKPINTDPVAIPDDKIRNLDENIKNAYAKVLRDEYVEEDLTHFAFAYVTPDEIPELIVLLYAGDLVSYTHIYEYVNGEAKMITRVDGAKENFGPYGCLSYKEKTGLVYVDYMRMGNAWHRLDYIENGTRKILHFFDDDYATGVEESEATFHADGVKVTYDEYERKLSECGFYDDNLIIIDAFSEPLVTEENIASLLEN